MYLTTLSGTLLIYQGQEIGQSARTGARYTGSLSVAFRHDEYAEIMAN